MSSMLAGLRMRMNLFKWTQFSVDTGFISTYLELPFAVADYITNQEITSTNLRDSLETSVLIAANYLEYNVRPYVR